MPRKLKVFQTSLGFYDLAIAAPSMKAALAAWGTTANLFHHGVAKESTDPRVIEAAMSKPGLVLQRPVGTDRPFKEHAELPTDLRAEDASRSKAVRRRSGQAAKPQKVAAQRKLQVAVERDQKRRERQRAREDASARKERARREKQIRNAKAALERAEAQHKRRLASMEEKRRELDERLHAEQERWERERGKLERLVRRANEQA